MHTKKVTEGFILGSSSTHRLETLNRLGFHPSKVIAADIDESHHKKELPKLYAGRVAMQKAEKLVHLHPGKNILTADTVACCGRRILPKAMTDQDVKFCLSLLSGRRHKVYTCICLADKSGTIRKKVVKTLLRFKQLSQKDIDFYLSTKQGIGKAGGYSIQGFAQCFTLWISGSYLSVVGLPAYETANLLNSVGIVPVTNLV